MSKFIVLTISLFFLFLSSAPAQSETTPKPAKAKLETVRGRVVEINRLPQDKNSVGGFEILLNSSNGGSYRVLLEPKLSKEFDQRGISAGDQVMVIGLTFPLGKDKKNFRASEIQKAPPEAH